MNPTYEEIEAKIALLEVQLKLSEAAERAWESSMMKACGEDGPKSVADKFAELESKLETALRECRSAGITIDNLEAKCAALPDELERKQQYIKSRDQENEDIALTVGRLRVELEAAEKLIDTLRQDKDKVIDMSIERVNKLPSRAEAAEKRIAELESLTAPKLPQQAVVVPDELANKSFEYIANKFQVSISDAQWILVGWNACSAAMLHRSEPETDNTNQQFESLSRGDK